MTGVYKLFGIWKTHASNIRNVVVVAAVCNICETKEETQAESRL